MSRPPLIHIGYHKTATNWMQRQLFLPVHGYRQIAGHQEVGDILIGPHGLTFDPQPVRDLIQARSVALGANEVAVISSELLSGNPFYGGRESDDYARRLHLVEPNARILISIRAQLRILPSIYMQYIRRGGTMPPDTFFAGEKELGYFGFSEKHWEYDRLVAYYQSLFGRENVYVLQQEELLKDIDGTMQRLAQFAGNSGFKGLVAEARRKDGLSEPEYAVPILRRINHVMPSAMHRTPAMDLASMGKLLYRGAGYVLRRSPASTALAHRRPISDLVRDRFAGRFDDSNVRLAAICTNSLDLSAYR